MERDQIHAFGWREIRRMVKEKNKAVTPRLAFPFCLKTDKSKEAFRKRGTLLLLFWKHCRVVRIFPRNVSKALIEPVLAFVDF